MQIRILGFSFDPKTPIARWIVYSSIALFGIAMLARGFQATDDLRERVERVAGFDIPAGIQPEWQTRPKRRSINAIQAWTRGYRLPDDLAQQLMSSCEQRGGRILERDMALVSFPELDGRISANAPACIRSEDKPSRAISMLQATQLVVYIRRH